MKLKQGSARGTSRLFDITIPLADDADPEHFRKIANDIYRRNRRPFTPRDIHGTWSASWGVDGRPHLTFSGYILKGMPLFGRRKKTVRVLGKIVKRVVNYVPLSSHSFHIISMFYGRRHYHLEYQ